jgi:hypothetical protein
MACRTDRLVAALVRPSAAAGQVSVYGLRPKDPQSVVAAMPTPEYADAHPRACIEVRSVTLSGVPKEPARSHLSSATPLPW